LIGGAGEVKEYRASALRELAADELQNLLNELREELFNLRFRNSLKQLDDALRIRHVRRAIARVETMLDEDRKGIRKLGSSAV
jgi:large subunit ribosomal protein L29